MFIRQVIMYSTPTEEKNNNIFSWEIMCLIQLLQRHFEEQKSLQGIITLAKNKID